MIRGEYVESCNCEVLCPCLLGPRTAEGWAMAPPTEGHCDVPMVFRIFDGHYQGTPLAGTRFALSIYSPGIMGHGNFTLSLYLDERAAPEQRAAGEQIFGGQAGGPIGRFIGPLTTTRLPSRVVPIEFRKEGRRCWASIPGVLDLELEGVLGKDGGASWLDNLRHFVDSRLYTYRSVRSTYRDHAFDWNNAGRNAYWASFDWEGP
jgi:hypothetical protein